MASVTIIVSAVAAVVLGLQLNVSSLSLPLAWGIASEIAILVGVLFLLQRDRRTRSSALATLQHEHRSRSLMLSRQADILQCLQGADFAWGNADSALPRLTELAARILQAQHVTLWIRNEDKGIVCVDRYETSGDTHHSGTAPNSMDVPDAVRTACNDAGAAATEKNVFWVDDLVTSATEAMYLPIFRSGTRKGVLAIERGKPAEEWSAEERLLGLTISTLAMLILEQDAHRMVEDTLRERERALAQALNRSESAARAQDAFLATVSHELRTPLNAILGFNELLLENTCSAQERNRYLTLSREAGNALLLQVNDLLDMAKIEAGKIQLESIDFDFARLVENCVGLVRERARKQNLAITIAISEDLPVWMLGDPARLRQVLLNLLSNALKFTERGSISVCARMADTGMFEVSVADTGCGIPSDKLEKIFEKFSQLDASISRRFGGTGLGLAICKSLVNLMDGEIRGHSTLGSGSIFCVRLPLRLGAARPTTDSGSAGTRRGRVLLVEDDEANAILATALLKGMGQEVQIAEDGVAALQELSHRDYDLVLMDLQLPVMGGLETARKIRTMPGPMRQVRIVAMSAHALGADVERCKKAGMDDCMVKPVDRHALQAILGRWLGPEANECSAIAISEGSAAETPVAALAATIGRSRAVKVAHAFAAALPRRLELFRSNVQSVHAIALETHNMANISGPLGFAELGEIARRVERRCSEHGTLEDLMPELIRRSESAAAALHALLADEADQKGETEQRLGV